MDLQQRTLRIGLTAILFAGVIRLCSMDLGVQTERVRSLLNRIPLLSSQETGQAVRFSPSFGNFSPEFVETPVPSPPEPEIPCFSDTSSIEVFYASRVTPSLDTLIRQPLKWQLSQEEPTVLILHTHTTESYTQNGEGYRETAAYRTLDEGYNMLSIGDLVARYLEEQGIRVVHDRTLHDYPSYNGSYSDARESIRSFLKANPGIQLVLDLHRDASDENSSQLRTLAASEETPCAQLMVVIGTNHKNYEENLSLGLKLHAQLELQSPGITRPLQLRSQRFNQDLLPGALLIEVGAAGNTHEEARQAARQLAMAIAALQYGTAEAPGSEELGVRS